MELGLYKRVLAWQEKYLHGPLQSVPKQLRIHPNILTVSRVIIVPYILFMSPFSQTWGAIVLAAGVFAFTDFFDGVFARAWYKETVPGKCLDPIADRINILSFMIYTMFVLKVVPPPLSIIAIIAVAVPELIIVADTLYRVAHIRKQMTDYSLKALLEKIDQLFTVSHIGKIKTTFYCFALFLLALGGITSDQFLFFTGMTLGICGFICALMTMFHYISQPL